MVSLTEIRKRKFNKMMRESSKRNLGRVRMTEISVITNKLTHRLQRKGRDMLKLACDCGKLLNEAKAINKIGKYGSWKKWLYENYEGSYENARDYMRVAREWNSPDAKEARRKGVHFDNIKSFLDWVKERRGSSEKKILTPKQQKDIDYRRELLRDLFAERIDELDEWERKLLYENFDNFWFKLYDELKRIILLVYDYDPEWDEDEIKDAEELKREAREIVGQRMKSKKT